MAPSPKKRAGQRGSGTDRISLPAPLKAPDEVAAFLAVSVLGVYRLLRTGRLRGHKVGGKWRVSDDAVRQFLEDQIQVRK